MTRTSLPLLACAFAALALAGCQSANRNQELAYVERPVEALYNQAFEQLDMGDYTEAIQLFNEVERQHPFTDWARRSMLMTAYSQYELRRHTEAIGTAQRYISLHQGDGDAAYAYYLIALSHFDQIVDVGRDQGTTVQAREALQSVIARFPRSDYARDAAVKLDMVNDQLAGKEMEVGRWYLRRSETLPALNRFKRVVTEFDTTTHAPEALHRLVEGYLTLGLREEARRTGAVLGYNYPASDWYKRSYRLLTGEGLDPDAVSEEEREGLFGRLFGS